MTTNRGLLIGVGAAAAIAAAVYWFTSGSPQAQYYRAENARRDTVEWLSSPSLWASAESAKMEVANAASRYHSLHRRFPGSVSEWYEAGLAAGRVTGRPPNCCVYYSAHRAPPLRGEATDSFQVVIVRDSYSGELHYSASLYFGGGILTCRAGCTLER